VLSALGVLKLARRFVLVGDHFQLPPLVRAAEGLARGGGAAAVGAEVAAEVGQLSESLMGRLARSHPSSVLPLRTQWRMCADIASVANSLFYSGLLECGSQQVARRRLQLPLGALQALAGEAGGRWQWASEALSPEWPVVVCDSDSVRVLGARGGSTTNEGEAQVAVALAACALRLGVPVREVAIISPFRAQLGRIRQLLDSPSADAQPGGGGEAGAGGHSGAGSTLGAGASGAALAAQLRAVDVLTVDQSQGQDRMLVIISLAKHNKHGAVGSLLADWRRLNVALTRAQAKLIVLGSRSTLGGSAVPAELFALAVARGWLLELPPHASATGGEVGAPLQPPLT